MTFEASSASWKSFVASSYTKSPTKNDDAGGGGSLFGLQQALRNNTASIDSPNNSGVSNLQQQQTSPSSKLPSFFIAKKDSLFGGDHQNINKTAPTVRSSSSTKMRDIALKHLFQPELINAANSSTSMTMKNFLPSSRNNQLRNGESKAITSVGITPLETAPLRLGVRKRLGIAILNQRRDFSSRRRSPHRFEEDEEQDTLEENQGRRNDERDDAKQNNYNTQLLRHVGNRILLSRESEMPTKTTSDSSPSSSHHSHTSLPQRKSAQKTNITSSSTIAGEDPSSRSHYRNGEDEKEVEDDDDQQQTILQKHIEEAACRARSLSYSQLYEESIQRERELEKQKREKEEGSPQERLRKLQQEQEELERQKMFSEGDEFEVVGNNQQDKNNNKKNHRQQQHRHQDPNTVDDEPSTHHQNTNRQLLDTSSSSTLMKQVDKTGDFKTPLTLARQSLQTCYQTLEEDHGVPASQVSHIATTNTTSNTNKASPKTRQLASTVNYLQGKLDSLSGVANRVEQEEHRMRMATATILAEILALKKLEDAAKNEALSWVEYGEDTLGEEEEENNTRSDSRVEEAHEVATAARDFLIDLE